MLLFLKLSPHKVEWLTYPEFSRSCVGSNKRLKKTTLTICNVRSITFQENKMAYIAAMILFPSIDICLHVDWYVTEIAVQKSNALGMGNTFGKKGKHQLILLYKIVNNQAPGYLRNLLPDRVDNRHYHHTRQSANILEISSKTKLYSDYFLPSSIKLWNRLPIDTRNSRSLNIFKERIKTQNSKCPAY